MIVISQSVASTSAAFLFSGVPSGTLLIESQYSTRQDFQWVLSPLVRVGNLSGMTLAGLNQAARYFVRSRPISTSGTVGGWSNTVGIYTPAAALRNTAPAAVMIEPALIVPAEPVLSWYADNEAAGYPARALGRDDPNSSWWSSRVGANFSFEALLSGAPIDTIAVLETCAAEDATIRVKAGADASNVRGSSPSFQTAFQPFRASAGLPGRRAFHALVRLPAPQAYPYWRVEIGGSAPGDLFAATWAVFGRSHSTRNFATDSKSETLLDSGTLTRDRSGNPDRVTGRRGRSVDFEIQNMTEAQYETAFEELRWRVGTTDPVLVVPNSKPGVFLHDRILYGQMAAGRATNTSSPRFTQAFTITSQI